MRVRVLFVALGAALAAAGLAWALDGNPVQGVGVSVETSPGGIKIAEGPTNKDGVWTWKRVSAGTYVVSVSGDAAISACKRAAQDAEAAAAASGVGLRKGRGVAVSRGGGSFRMRGAEGPGVAVFVTGPAGELQAEWLDCGTLLDPPATPPGERPVPPRARLSPVTLPAAAMMAVTVRQVPAPTPAPKG